ncbi:Uu.00g049030.m01.CDS01 [Anthostomella pinea]|uniref:Uu.00g049030.m01.CDS01 n=1 Tax=Anthostomella pinea TaxID=933095 RepID=A0AAI8YER1_9PEZI|nr:Uu.00g049030.m01.CDS01 [Anthostomella pinea]
MERELEMKERHKTEDMSDEMDQAPDANNTESTDQTIDCSTGEIKRMQRMKEKQLDTDLLALAIGEKELNNKMKEFIDEEVKLANYSKQLHAEERVLILQQRNMDREELRAMNGNAKLSIEKLMLENEKLRLENEELKLKNEATSLEIEDLALRTKETRDSEQDTKDSGLTGKQPGTMDIAQGGGPDISWSTLYHQNPSGVKHLEETHVVPAARTKLETMLTNEVELVQQLYLEGFPESLSKAVEEKNDSDWENYVGLNVAPLDTSSSPHQPQAVYLVMHHAFNQADKDENDFAFEDVTSSEVVGCYQSKYAANIRVMEYSSDHYMMADAMWNYIGDAQDRTQKEWNMVADDLLHIYYYFPYMCHKFFATKVDVKFSGFHGGLDVAVPAHR